MSRKQSIKNRLASAPALPVIRSNAAGIDIGATKIWVCVPSDRAEPNVRCFDSFTSDLNDLANWLAVCKVKTVAMESTGVYWIPLYNLLEQRKLEVFLVNSKHYKNVAAKSDASDCRWLQQLHSVGLLRGSFRPNEQVVALRELVRSRDTFIVDSGSYVQRIHKSLTQMNLQIHNVISDIVGQTGLAMLDAILAGERDPFVLVKLCDPRIRASETDIIKSLVGQYRREHLFAIKESLNTWRGMQQTIARYDAEIEQLLIAFDLKIDSKESAYVPSKSSKKKPVKNEIKLPAINLSEQMYRIFGTDLTLVPGLGPTNVHTLFSELGSDLTAFPTAKSFANWLGLCPDNRVSGGKKLSVKTKKSNNKVATLLRVAAQSLLGNESYLGSFYRRMRARLGAPKAITATAHKLANIIYHLITTGQQYDESIFEHLEAKHRERKVKLMTKTANILGYQLVAIAM